MSQDLREDLKKITKGYLDETASSLFIDKSLKIIDESANNKESFVAAAVWIGRRVSAFIDKRLAQTVYDSLVSAIEKSDVPRGTKRRYMRVPFCKKVRVGLDGTYREVDSENLSEGGILIMTNDPFPAGSLIEISLPLDAGNIIKVKGVVLQREGNSGDKLRVPRGMAVEFKDIGKEKIEALRLYIRKVPIQSSL